MSIKDLLVPKEQLVALDIGSGNIKMLEIDVSGSKPHLTKLSIVNFNDNVFNNNIIVQKEIVSEAISSLYKDNELKKLRANICVPGPAALMKKIRIPKTKAAALREQIMLEAASILPGSIKDVMIDYHILDTSQENSYDVLVVAVKNEVVDSYLMSLEGAGVDTAVVDIDYYAINNAFELNYPELKQELIAIIDVGSRFSNIILRQNDEILYAGDVSIGGQELTDELVNRFDLEKFDAEKYKFDYRNIKDEQLQKKIVEFLSNKVASLAKDFSRQLNLFWGSSGAEMKINQIFLTGGGSLISGFKQALESVSGTDVYLFDPFRVMEINLDIDESSLAELAPLFTVAVGLGIRQAGDRIKPKN